MRLPAGFCRETSFHRALKTEIDAYFAATGRRRRDVPRMFVKSGVILAWLAGSYAFLMWIAQGPLALVAGAISLGLAMAGVGFSIQHDANHEAYSRHRAINRGFGALLDVMGGSSYLWRWKHNIFHHTHPNVASLDTDVEFEPLIRMAPTQKRLALQRVQIVYAWALYATLAIYWQFIGDFVDVALGHIKGRGVPRPRRAQLGQLVIGKAIFFGWAAMLPLLLHPLREVAAAFAITSAVLGLTLSVVFQLAHCVDAAAFPTVPVSGRFATDFAAHQLETTVDFARGNRLATWYLGGLNYQIEHHLFPRICHVHYPALAPIVERVCRAHHVAYRAHETFAGALASHARWLRRMGRAAEPAPASGITTRG